MLKLKIEKRSEPIHPILAPLLSIISALVFSSALLSMSGSDPTYVYTKMFIGAFGRPHGIAETLTKSIPLMLCGLSVIIALKVGFWNIGAEGQMYMGAVTATALALTLGNFHSSYILLPLMMFLSFLVGAAWAFIPALLKAKLGINEILVTLMMNYIAILITTHLVNYVWYDRYGFPQTELFPLSAQLPRLLGTRLHIAIFIAILSAFFLYLLLSRTTIGYEIRVAGNNPEAARYAGMNLTKIILIATFIGGGLAGIAGMSEVSGALHQLRYDFSPGYGYIGILVAFLSKLNPLAVIPVSIFLGGLLVGVNIVQIVMMIPYAIANVLTGLILFFVAGGEILSRYKIKVKL